VNGNGTYNPSAGFIPSTVGNYWWYASYNGDTNNSAANSTCGAAMAETVVAKASPAATATAPATGTAGTTIATASIGSVLSSATSGAGGTVTFTVFGPQASAPVTCTSGGTAAGTATVTGSGTYHPSSTFTPSTVGNYWWYASYNGDTNNNAATSPCGAAMAETVVAKASPSETATAPATAVHGNVISKFSIGSVLSAGASPTGTITFKVFGPLATAPATCAGGTTVGTAAVAANGTFHSNSNYTPASAGNYWWYDSYNGDANNSATNSTCGAGMTETIVS
jgi:hypothetical protein